jgi:hypothetical protein
MKKSYFGKKNRAKALDLCVSPDPLAKANGNKNQINNQNPVFAVQLPSASPANRNPFNKQDPVFAVKLPSASADCKRLRHIF